MTELKKPTKPKKPTPPQRKVQFFRNFTVSTGNLRGQYEVLVKEVKRETGHILTAEEFLASKCVTSNWKGTQFSLSLDLENVKYDERVARYEKSMKRYEKALETYKELLAQWKKQEAAGRLSFFGVK